MSGFIFYGTGKLDELREFYTVRCGMDLWLEQGDCVILSHGNLLLGFCTREEVETQGIIGFFYPRRETVDDMYKELTDIALDEPRENPKYGIYHFFGRDPEGRKVEFQSFLHPVEPHLRGDEVLRTRRSVRRFTDEPVPDGVLARVFEACRFAPTSHNSQSYYYIVIRDREKMEFLASLRDPYSRPIANGPLAVALCADPGKTKRVEQDGCIGAYHFLLAARLHGLGTCWIAAMDREDAKVALGVPSEHYIATVTPLGYPAKEPETPERRPAGEMVRYIG